MKWLTLLIFVVFPLLSSGQKRMKDIEMQRIPQKKIREFILNQQKRIFTFRDISPSCIKGEDLSGLNELSYTYLLKYNIDQVWEKYNTTSPAASWNGAMISFGMLLSKNEEYIIYRDDPTFSSFNPGQVFYVNLGLLGGLYNLAVGLEIVDVNEKGKYVQFSYLEDGKSKGLQTIRLFQTEDGNTLVEHHTLYKSDSPFRDKILYPFFHKRAITEFHRNMDSILSKDDLYRRSKKHLARN